MKQPRTACTKSEDKGRSPADREKAMAYDVGSGQCTCGGGHAWTSHARVVAGTRARARVCEGVESHDKNTTTLTTTPSLPFGGAMSQPC